MKNQQLNQVAIPQSLLQLNASMISSDSVVIAPSSADKHNSPGSCMPTEQVIGILDEVLAILHDGFLDDFQETTSGKFTRTADTFPDAGYRGQ